MGRDMYRAGVSPSTATEQVRKPDVDREFVFFGGVNLLSWKWTDISKKHQRKKRMKKNGTVFWSILRPRLSSIFAVKLEFHARNLIVINLQKPLDWDDGSCKDMGGFLKWWYPTTMDFPTKNDHFGVFRGYHHLKKHPHWLCKKNNQHHQYMTSKSPLRIHAIKT